MNTANKTISLSKDINTEGFDYDSGKIWIFPTNYSIREYQYNIIEQALLKNTMVSLPTGLGKTFIAAVVMYNFYRWYPNGKIIFMAPTRPLVKQQVDACYNIMAIPKEATAELTGSKAQSQRKEVWDEKRVFFITPQILQNDLNILSDVCCKIKCIVFDEAHKAKGNHAYCQVIRKLSPENKNFRVLALSATPGSTLDAVLEVIQNLLISHLEIRTEDSADVVPYIFERTLETVVVPLGEKLQEIRDLFIQILEKYTRVLIRYKIITGNCSTLTKGKIFMTMKDFQQQSRTNRCDAYNEIMRNLNICVTLYHGYELLIRHGLRGFLSFFKEHSEKPLLRGNVDLQRIMQDIEQYLGPSPDITSMPDGTFVKISEVTKFGHPKFYKLQEILTNHFKTLNGSGSRVIVFFEYRESVMEAFASLLNHAPLIKTQIFLGQGAMSQAQQLNVIKLFRAGECNTLLSTCIGEEGLDVGEVDLIICFDINSKSPIRMVQRMGRTGRKKQGKIVVLVTEGKEQQTLKECLIHKQNLGSHILKSTALKQALYSKNPRMIPENMEPKCKKLFITVKPNIKTPKNNRNANIGDLIKKIQINLASIDCEEIQKEERLPLKQYFWNKPNPLNVINKNSTLDFYKRISKQRSLQNTDFIAHSKSSNLLVSMLQLIDLKKFNLSNTQQPVTSSQIFTQNATISPNIPLKQVDIRNMFLKANNFRALQKDPQENLTVDKYLNVLDKLFMQINNINVSIFDECKICKSLFNCPFIYSNDVYECNFKKIPDIECISLGNLNITNLNNFEKSLKCVIEEQKKSNSLKTEIKILDFLEDSLLKEFEQTSFKCSTVISENLQNTLSENVTRDCNNSEVLKEGEVKMFEKISPFKPPNSVENVLKKCGITSTLNKSDDVLNELDRKKCNVGCDISSELFNMQHSIDCKTFNDAAFTQLKPYIDTFQDTLTFFNMSDVHEIFNHSNFKVSQETVCYSPKMKNKNDSDIYSPILSSYSKSRLTTNATPRKLFKCSNPIDNIYQNLDTTENSKADDNLQDTTNLFLKKQTTNSVIIDSKKLLSVSVDTLSDEDIFDDSELNIIDSSRWKRLKSSANNIETEQPSNKTEELYDNLNLKPNHIKKITPNEANSTTNLNDFCDNSFLDNFFDDNVDIISNNEKIRKTLSLKEKTNCQIGTEELEYQSNDKLVDTIIENEQLHESTINLNYESYTKEMLNKSPSLLRSQNRFLNDFKNSQFHRNEVFEKGRNLLCDNLKNKNLTFRDFNTINKNTTNNSLKLSCLDNKFLNSKLKLKNKSVAQSQNLNTTLHNLKNSELKSKFNIYNLTDSEDEFELIKKNYKKKRYKHNVDENNKAFSVSKSSSNKENHYIEIKEKLLKKNLEKNTFLNLEAEMVLDDNASFDSDISENLDEFEASFVDDESHNLPTNDTMQAVYLESVKDCLNNGKFKIPKKTKQMNIDVFSQPVDNNDDTYLNDSFCVNTENFESNEDVSDNETELDIAEKILEGRKRRKSKQKPANKRKRLMIFNTSDESE